MTDRWTGTPIADRLLADVRAQVEAAVSAGRRRPALVSVHRGEATPFSVYLGQQAKIAERAGITFSSVVAEAASGGPGLARTVEGFGRDDGTDAVLVEHPLPSEWEFGAAIDRLPPEKDVDGVGTANLGRLAAGHPVQVPAVARAALHLARSYHVELTGRSVTVVGRSETVGRPLALLLLTKGIDATVTVAHSKTRDLARALAGTEVIFACAGQPGLLTRANVPQGAAVIDVGLTTVPDPTRPSGHRIVGDADGLSLEGWASAISPVPGGVGPLTVACLMENVLRSWNLRMGAR